MSIKTFIKLIDSKLYDKCEKNRRKNSTNNEHKSNLNCYFIKIMCSHQFICCCCCSKMRKDLFVIEHIKFFAMINHQLTLSRELLHSLTQSTNLSLLICTLIRISCTWYRTQTGTRPLSQSIRMNCLSNISCLSHIHSIWSYRQWTMILARQSCRSLLFLVVIGMPFILRIFIAIRKCSRYTRVVCGGHTIALCIYLSTLCVNIYIYVACWKHKVWTSL